MIKTYNVTINTECQKLKFLEKLKNISCSCSDACDNIPNTLVVNIEETDINELLAIEDVINVTEEPDAFPVNLPIFFSKSKIYTAIEPSLADSGSDYSSLQFYFLNNQLDSTQTFGWHPSDDSSETSGRYISFWTGRNVDIVTLEVNVERDYVGYHDTHPDFKDIDNPTVSKVVPEDWPNASGPNLQVSSNNVLSKHAIGVASAAAGTICGFAKGSSIRAFYLTSIIANMNSIIAWHNSKPVNPLTNKVNPTILLSEYQYLLGNRIGCKIENILSFTHLGNTITRPPGGWGNDFTPFVQVNMIPKRIRDPQTLIWHWCIVAPIQSEFTQLKTAIETAWDAGIIVMNAAGNDGTVYSKNSDPSYDSTIAVEAGAVIFNIDRTSDGTAQVTNSTLSTTQDYFVFRTFGPAGLDKSIDVAALQNSQTFPILDPYSVRGPGIDATGLGEKTWTSYPINTYGDGFQWGMFGGTSCAAPSAAGIAACVMERYFYYHQDWPTANQIKEILSNLSKKEILLDGTTTNWSSTPAADSAITQSEFADGGTGMAFILSGFTNLNGGVRLRELAGTTNSRPFIDNSVSRVNYTSRNRPNNGFVYPRTQTTR